MNNPIMWYIIYAIGGIVFVAIVYVPFLRYIFKKKVDYLTPGARKNGWTVPEQGIQRLTDKHVKEKYPMFDSDKGHWLLTAGGTGEPVRLVGVKNVGEMEAHLLKTYPGYSSTITEVDSAKSVLWGDKSFSLDSVGFFHLTVVFRSLPSAANRIYLQRSRPFEKVGIPYYIPNPHILTNHYKKEYPDDKVARQWLEWMKKHENVTEMTRRDDWAAMSVTTANQKPDQAEIDEFFATADAYIQFITNERVY